MEQIGGTGYANYPFKVKTHFNSFFSFKNLSFDFSKEKFEIFTLPPPSALRRKAYAKAFNHPNVAGDRGSKVLSMAQT
ncbi:hypothetical protein E1A91_A07G179500v1 [Gossypium mustelinum]|uniref:Uncharacterized protein n=1 Tax=Gossypium mustelinum TaxID=34275 RepID=A0A5D2YLR9_GOSMU|nr:hypothetical protein E1A91_A07G179500v1 [Gossypium mustelinum]